MKFQSKAITLFRQKKFRKITRRNGKENNALSTEMENTKIIICEKQVMHMLKCQEAAEKLIAFCHKHSVINMITFAYFILLLICCLGDSYESCTTAPKGKSFSLLLRHETTTRFLLGIFMLFMHWQTQTTKHRNISVSARTIIPDQECDKWLSYI